MKFKQFCVTTLLGSQNLAFFVCLVYPLHSMVHMYILFFASKEFIKTRTGTANNRLRRQGWHLGPLSASVLHPGTITC